MEKDDNVLKFGVVEGGVADDEDVAPSEDAPPSVEELLDRAKEAGFEDVIIIGYTPEKDLGLLTTNPDEMMISYTLEKLKLWIHGV